MKEFGGQVGSEGRDIVSDLTKDKTRNRDDGGV